MKKLLTTIAILTLLATPALAQRRGAQTNVFASWVSVTGTQTITFPYNSRDIWIHNGSAVDIYVDLKGREILAQGYNVAQDSTIQLNGTADLYLTDYVTGGISVFSTTGAAASPVSVLVTY